MTRPRHSTSRLRTDKSVPSRPLGNAAEAWVRKTLRRMTLDEKLGQMLMIPCYGGFLPEESGDFRELLRHVEHNHAGGLMIATRPGTLGIERSQAYATAAVINRLQDHAKIPLLVAGDFERGTAMRVEEGTSFPHAMAVAATGRAEDAATLGRITALEAQAVGVPWVFAPVADVNSDPNNPIINVRSFGEDPQRVAEFVVAYVRAVESHGALATAKHFPGHGDTATDSHLDLPTVKSNLAHLESIDLLPFRAAIAAGASAVMTGHLAVPAIEPDQDVPATLSKKITTELLRSQMCFDGLVVTDAMDMGGVSLRYSPPEAAVRAVLAGSDVLLQPPSPDAALAGLREAAASGRLPATRIDEAVKRILRAKARLGLHLRRTTSLEELPSSLRRPEYERAAQDIADRSVTLLRDEAHILPLDATRPSRVLLVAIAGDADRTPSQEFERELRWRVDSLQTLRFDTRFSNIEALQLPDSKTFDVMLVALSVRVADRKGTVGLLPAQVEAVNRLLGIGKPVVVICFGSPYIIARFRQAKTWLAAFSTADAAQRAAARGVFGQIAVGGRIPVRVPGAAVLGAGLDVEANPMKLIAGGDAMDAALAPVYRWLDRAVAQHDCPGGALAVGLGNRFAIHAFGKVSYAAKSPAAKPAAIYDTASLTKPVVTTTLAAMLAESGQLDIDAPVSRYVPEWTAASLPQMEWRARATVRHLLTHTSGLPAHREYFKTLKSHREIAAAAIREPLSYEPGAQSVYSDVGFLVLGEIVERLTGRSLDVLARERIFDPLSMTDTMFTPGKPHLARIAPVEDETRKAKPLPRGQVHDDNARAMGGVAPHSGMFSTAHDLAIFCQMLLNGGIYAHRRLLRRDTIAAFTAPSPLSSNTRTLGWMCPTEPSSSGHHFSPSGFGHLGFTGTSIWIDPEKQLFVVLLTNRVNPSRDRIRQLRADLHDAVVEALGLATTSVRH